MDGSALQLEAYKFLTVYENIKEPISTILTLGFLLRARMLQSPNQYDTPLKIKFKRNLLMEEEK